MAKQVKTAKVEIEHIKNKTSIARNPRMVKYSTMNKSMKRSYKVYRGQGTR